MYRRPGKRLIRKENKDDDAAAVPVIEDMGAQALS
jgi:hypothetical protein